MSDGHHNISAVDDATTVDKRMFGAAWWAQPLPARYESMDAHRVGLLVQVEKMKRQYAKDVAACITWRGTAAQFSATKAFPKGVDPKRSCGRHVATRQLRGTVYPAGADQFLFVIEWVCAFFGGPQRRARRIKEALSDDSYRKFRDSLLQTAEIADGLSDAVRLDGGFDAES